MSRKRPAEALEESHDPYETQVLTESKRMPLHLRALDKVLLKTDGKDIVKKSSSRKGRYLIAVAGQLAQLAAGKMGTLAELDSQTPVLYLDCPGGRIKLSGRLTFLRNKYITLRVGAKHALCEDVFDMLVLFSKACWVGSTEDNPDEEQLAWPEAVLAPDPAEDAMDPLDPLAAPQGKPGRQRGSPRPAAGADDESSEDDEEPFTQAATQPTPQLRGSARRSSAKRPNYAEARLSDDPEQDDDGSQEANKQSDGLPDAKAAQQTAPGKSRKTAGLPSRRQAASASPDEPGPSLAIDSGRQSRAPARPARGVHKGTPKGSGDPKGVPGSAAKGAGKPPSSTKAAAGGSKQGRAGKGSRQSIAAISLLSSDEDGLSPAEFRRPGGRAAKTAASKALMFQSQGDEDDGSHTTSPEPSDDADYE